MVVVVFDQVGQVGEGQFTVQVDAVLLSEERHGRIVAGIVADFFLFVRHHLINAGRSWLQAAGLLPL